jgi:hypothetical protein
MFDRKFTLTSTDGTVSLQIDADSGGLKSLQLVVPPAPPQPINQQQLIDLMAPFVREKYGSPAPAPPDAPNT